MKRKERREARCLKGEEYTGQELWCQVFAKRFHVQFAIPIFPWCFLNRRWAMAELPVPQCTMPMALGAPSGTAEFWNPAFGAELVCWANWCLTVSFVFTTCQVWRMPLGVFCLLLQGLLLNNIAVKPLLLLTQETFSGVNCKSSIQKIRLSFFPKIIGSHYSRHLLWKLNTLLKVKAKPFE